LSGIDWKNLEFLRFAIITMALFRKIAGWRALNQAVIVPKSYHFRVSPAHDAGWMQQRTLFGI